MQFGVNTVMTQQTGMIALLQKLALIEHQNMIGMLNSGKPVRNHQRGTIAH